MTLPDRIYRGPWCPTNYLRWNKQILEQKMRRKIKRQAADGGSCWDAGYEYEWQPIPKVKK